MRIISLMFSLIMSCFVVLGQETNSDSSLTAFKKEIVIVEVVVDSLGNVLEAIPGIRGTTTRDTILYRKAREAALKTKFSPEKTPFNQKGQITFQFKVKREDD